MPNARPYDYVFHPPHMNPVSRSPHTPHDLMIPFGFRRLAVLVVLAPHIFSTSVTASPLQLQLRSSVQERDQSSVTLSPKTWAPILVVVLALLGAMIAVWKRKGFRIFNGAAAAIGASVGAVTGQAGTRELTAEQLAGTINSNNAAATNTNSAANRTRRARRPRRTPSQISTTSLPAYNKEPGEEELVIFRGTQDMEDAPIPTAIVMNSVDEDEEASLHTGDHSQASRYTPMSTSSNNVPYAGHEDPSGDLSMQSLSPPPGEDMPRRSYYNNSMSSHEMSSLMRLDSNGSTQEPDPRGEAPPYFEVVDQSVDQGMPYGAEPNSADSETTALRTATTPPSSPENARQTQRRSGFRSLFNRMSVVATPQPSTHTRNDSGQSTTPSHGREASASRASHRPSQSGSGSLLTSSMFRTLSRQKSTTTLASNRLNSPSLISLNSISSPLTHTVMRTEFTYPKSGPTPEQLKLISSRESFARFGMPYGADAIAFAASASRQDLEPPPPDFDAAGSDTHLPRSAAPGPSRLRSNSNAEDLQRDRDSDSSDSEDEDDDGRASRHSSLTRPSPATVDSNVAVTTPLPDSAPSSPTPSNAVPSAQMKELQSSVASLSRTSSSKLFAPSAYQTPSGSSRSDSRASSYSVQSFATATETMEPSIPLALPSSVGASDISGPSTPTLGTPRIGAQHALEPTDTTITPAPAIGMAV